MQRGGEERGAKPHQCYILLGQERKGFFVYRCKTPSCRFRSQPSRNNVPVNRASDMHVRLIGPSVLFLFLRLYEASVHLHVAATRGRTSCLAQDARLCSRMPLVSWLDEIGTNARIRCINPTPSKSTPFSHKLVGGSNSGSRNLWQYASIRTAHVLTVFTLCLPFAPLTAL